MTSEKTRNRLAFEKSPYLLQHAGNPVDWYPWGVEAFEKAKRENKPIFLSIGYSTCHWCHVMAHESFEDIQVAKLTKPSNYDIKRLIPFTKQMSCVEGKATAYVCHNYNCKLPTTDIDTMLQLLDANQ